MCGSAAPFSARGGDASLVRLAFSCHELAPTSPEDALPVAIDIGGVAEARAGGDDASFLRVLHVRHLAEALNHRIVVHHDAGLLAANLGDRLGDDGGQVEVRAFPIAAWQVLAATVDGPVRPYQARAADADHRGKRQALFTRLADQVLEHGRQLVDGGGP